MSSVPKLPDGILAEDRGPNLRALTIAMMIIPTIAIMLRFWSRALLPGQGMSKGGPRFWWDDWMALGAAIFSLAVCGVGLRLIDLGLGKHSAVIPAEQQFELLKLLWVEYYIFDTGTSLAKSSALFFYARIFGAANSKFKYVLWATQAAVFIWLFAILIAVVFSCVPVQKTWMPWLSGTCSNEDTVWLGSVIPSITIDLVILLLPLPMLWRLQMKRVKKIMIVGVFICGYLVIVVSLGRLITIIQAGPGLQEDLTWNTVTPVFWLASEIPISVVCVCLPSIFFFVRRAYREGLTSLIRTTPSTSGARLHGSSLHDTEASPHHTGHSEEEAYDMGTSASDLTRKTAYMGPAAEYHVEAAKTSPYDFVSTDAQGKTSGSRIHVRSDVEVK